MTPASHRASEIAGLKSPPETLKKIHAQTARLNPKDNAIYNNDEVLSTVTASPEVDELVVEPVTVVAGIFATLVPPRAKNMNRVVPTSSPINARMWFFARSLRDARFVSGVICSEP